MFNSTAVITGHINAHFLICFVALTTIRLIQYRVLRHLGKDTTNEDGWESGISADKIKDALGTYQADPLPGGYYRMTKPDENMRLILESMGVDGALRLPTGTELRALKKAVDGAGMA